ncbi:ferredoxin [Haloechinothrix alba]|uniref:Ferredoxin n=1 Tax=Haloechinothrix alba TaxID=664784 RepID=A0A239AKH9_9PSEU|nr:ferredoxin [Haloechinothrix alba]SNR96157.1 ferredoxin [Haloechinothrix alba]
MRIVVDRNKCTGLGICESLAPDHFEVNDEGALVVLRDSVSEDELDAVQQAVEGCPTEALRLEN